MKLRTKLVGLSLLTLLLPWSGWKLLQELERFLREAQEGALLASARTLAGALPLEYRTRLLFAPELRARLRQLDPEPVLDGYADEWPGAGHGLEFESEGEGFRVTFLAGDHAGRLYLLFDIRDTPTTPASAAPTREIELRARSPRGLFSFSIRPRAPGPLQLNGDNPDSGQVEGYWLDSEGGARVELSLPAMANNTDISFRVRGEKGTAGPLVNPERPGWISLEAEWQGLSDWFTHSGSPEARTWLVDSDGWVLAAAGAAIEDGGARQAGTRKTTWLQRLLYRLVAGERTRILEQGEADPVRLNDTTVRTALSGREAVGWSQELETAVVWNTVAVPVMLEGTVHGAIVMESTSEGLLLVTNRALGRLLFTTLALTLGLAAGLWYFASRLSRRVSRLSGAVSRAMEVGMEPEELPLRDHRDELGELARNNQKLLRAVADYGQYLQTLASKLSHELKTPLAITRSSLDNLASQPLGEESRRFLQRAQEGVDRQAAIVRAMSEASRLEAAIGSAERERIDLAEFVRHCCEGYRAMHAGRALSVGVPGGRAELTCAPDLLAQALDKLVDNAMSLSEDADEVRVTLRSAERCYELAVANSGSRLPDELQERLFDSLVSLRDQRGAEPHLGLGLYIVRLVAEAHGGTVRAANLAGGEGVEFVISLPC